MRIPGQTHSRFLVGAAVLIFVFFGGTLAASGVASLLVGRRDPSRGAFAAVMPPPATEAISCTCVSCDAHGIRDGNCCCAGVDNATEAMAFRAVCDTPVDAITFGSPLPPAVLPFASAIHSALPMPLRVTSRLAALVRRTGSDAPLPPDAPPRFS